MKKRDSGKKGVSWQKDEVGETNLKLNRIS